MKDSKGSWILSLLCSAFAVLGSAAPAAAQEQPAVAKDSVQLRAFTYSSYKGSFDTFSWAPLITYRVNGPIPSGGQLYVEYTVPGAPAVKFNVPAGGKLDTSLAASNKLGTDRLIVPVTIIGDQDGVWDKAAWKTDAFYGNPLNGFTAAL